VIDNNVIILGIDASRNHSGGAKAHLIGFLSSINFSKCNIQQVHLWSFDELLNSIPDFPWLVKHCTVDLKKSIYRQLWWQAVDLKKEVKHYQCDILFTTDASTLCRFSPMIIMSQDMLSYEPGIMKNFGYGLARLRLIIILFVQNFAFRHADGVIFLTNYASRVIQKSCGKLRKVKIIPHGVDLEFKKIINQNWPSKKNEIIRCLYVSPVWPFKNQINVVKAIEKLRNQGYLISLDLIGGGSKESIKKLKKQISLSDPEGLFIKYHGSLQHDQIPKYVARANIFVFASSCENLPVTLLEAMAVGLPIVCSDRGPMPEVLGEGGLYFDPNDVTSIATSINEIIHKSDLRVKLMVKAKIISNEFTWDNNSSKTISFIEKTLLSIKKTVK